MTYPAASPRSFGEAKPALCRAVPNKDPIDRFFASAAQADQTAIVEDGDITTYGALAARVDHLAGIFAQRAAPRVLIAVRPGANAYAAMLAAGVAGGFYASLNVSSPASKWRQVCRMLQPDIIFGPAAITDACAPEAPDTLVVDPAVLLDAGSGPLRPQLARPPARDCVRDLHVGFYRRAQGGRRLPSCPLALRDLDRGCHRADRGGSYQPICQHSLRPQRVGKSTAPCVSGRACIPPWAWPTACCRRG